MTSQLSIDEKRAVLLNARMRFSPAGADVREQAVDRIIEQNLAYADATGMGLTDLQSLVTSGQGVPLLASADLQAGLTRLTNRGRVREQASAGTSRYTLTEEAFGDVDRLLTEAGHRWECVLASLSSGAPGGSDAYGEAFAGVLCTVFSRLSAHDVAVLTGKLPSPAAANHLMDDAVTTALSASRVPDAGALRYPEGATAFQKLTNAWPWFGGVSAVVTGFGYVFLGRERRQHLKWWKGE
jgi:hypothetical protein